MKKRKFFLMLFFSTLLLCLVTNTAFANGAACVSAEPIAASVGEECFIVLKIENNPGIMGFKLHFEYPYKDIEIISVSKGGVTQKGNLSDNIGNQKGNFDLLWNSTTDVSENGILAVLKCKVLSEKDFEIKVSYSQSDTFNEKWENVELKCYNIKTKNYQVEEFTSDLITDEKVDTNKNVASNTDKQETNTPENNITSNIISEKTDKYEDGFNVGFIIIDILKEKNIESFKNISEETKLEVVNQINQKLHSIFGAKDYFKNFEEVEIKFKDELKDELKAEVDSLGDNESSHSIIKNFIDKNKNQLTEDNITSLIEVFEEKGLNKKYSDYLSESELIEVLNDVYISNDTISVTKDKTDADYLNQNMEIILCISVFAIAIVILLVILLVKRKER